MEEAQNSMSHQCYPSTQRRSGKEGDLRIGLFQSMGILLDGPPSAGADSGTVFIQTADKHHLMGGIYFNHVEKPDMDAEDVVRSI